MPKAWMTFLVHPLYKDYLFSTQKEAKIELTLFGYDDNIDPMLRAWASN